MDVALSVPTHSTETESQSASRDVLWLLVICFVLFGFGLNFTPLANPDEARYGEIPREMLATGDFVTPRLDGIKYFEKPPLTYWLVAGSLNVFGFGEAAARATPAVFAALGILLTYAAGRAMGGSGNRVVGGLGPGDVAALFCPCPSVADRHGRIGFDQFDTVLFSSRGARTTRASSSFAILWALCERGPRDSRKRIDRFLLLRGAVMFLWLLLFNEWRRLRPFYLATGLMVFVAIALPWHLLVAQRNPEWMWFYFVHEHWLRFTTTTHGRYQPWWYFYPG